MSAPSSHHAQPRAEHAPKLLHRAAHTPARDWVRGRVTGRLDWRSDLARADLPAPIAALITTVVRRSRLWRLERADLARELIAHFADALAAGTAEENAVEDFGDTAQAARLIRRAKKRGRHWSYRAFIHTFQGLLAIFLAVCVVYAVLAWRFFSSEPTISRNFTAEYNETIEQIPEDDRAWDLYIETYTLLDPLPEPLAQNALAIAPSHPRYTEALEYLEAQQDVIALVHCAAAKPHLGAPFSDALDPRLADADSARDPDGQSTHQVPSQNPMLISILLPELGHMRAIARLLTFDAHVAASLGESDRAVRDIGSMLGVAGHSTDRPVLIGALVGLAIEALAIRTTAEIIHEYPDLFTDDQLRELAHRHAAFMGGDPHVDFTGERWFFEDIVQRVYTDDGAGNGHITAEGMRQLLSLGVTTSNTRNEFGPSPLAPITAAVVANRADMTAKYDEFMTQMERNARIPMWDYDARARTDEAIELLNLDPIQRVRFLPIVILMPALDKASHTAEHAKQRRDGVLAGIALELYHRDHGTYPASLDQLTPRYLPQVPPDRFTGEPLRYALVDGKPRLWSVGADRNDDGGETPAGVEGYESRWTPKAQAIQNEQMTPVRYDGDWLLWPLIYQPLARDPGDEPERDPGAD